MRSTRYHFGDCCLDVAARELWCANERVPLAAKAFDCLAYLIEHRDRAVGRDELVAGVWGRVDSEHNLLTQAIWRVRRAIGDGGNAENSLRTVPRFGYHWTAPVQVEIASAADENPAHACDEGADTVTPSSPARAADSSIRASGHVPRRPRAWGRLATVATAMLTVLIASAVTLLYASHKKRSPANATTVVVLPVGVADASTDTAWLRLGAMDYIASRLRDAHLGVMPSERVVALVKPTLDASGPNAEERKRLAGITDAGYLLVPRATHSDDGWHFAIDAYHDQRARTYRADAASPLQAADAAAASFLMDVGRGAGVPSPPPGAVDELLQRVDAASLASDLVEARRQLESAPSQIRDQPQVQLRRARLAFRSGRLEEAEALFAPLAADRSDGPASMRALAQMGLGGIAVRRHHYADAEPFYTAAITTLGENGEAGLLGRAYNERAIVRAGLGRLDLAIADMGRAHGALERSGDPVGSAFSNVNAALIAAQRGRYADAMGIFDHAIATFERFGVTDGLATALANKANLQLGALDAKGAMASSTRAWSLLPQFEDRRLIEFVAQNHIRALRSNGRLVEAERILDRFDGADGAPPSADPAFATLRAALLVDQGKGALALQLTEEIFDRIKHAPAGSCSDTIPEAALVLTEASLQSKVADSARPLIARLGEFVESPQDSSWTFVTELARGLILAADDDADAERHFAAALAMADSQGEPAEIITAAAPYASYVAGRAERAHAADLLAHVAPYADRDFRAARAAAQLHLLLDERDPALKARNTARALAGERVTAGL